MILICEACTARYLVPATVFANGPRQVKCARCAHEWQAALAPDAPIPSVFEKVPTSSEMARGQTAQSENPTSDPVSASASAEASAFGASAGTPQPLSSLTPSGVPFVEPPTSTIPVPPGSALPALIRNPIWHWVGIAGAIFGCIALLTLLIWGLLAREEVTKTWPFMEPVYNSIGLVIPHPGDGFLLQNINSERRFEDGGVQLVITGQLKNDTTETLLVPYLLASAITSDGVVIQHWQIDPPTARLLPGAVVSFQSSIRSPSGSVAEINLSFIEGPTNDDKAHH